MSGIVIVTAEPRGAYHLAPLGEALQASRHDFTHLIPYPEPVQGEAVIEVTSKLSVVGSCDRLVVTGGTWSAWTEAVARHAHTQGKPIVFSELAAVSDAAPASPPIPVNRVTALSADGAASLARHLKVEVAAVEVTGTPALDKLPSWSPKEKQALLLSTSDMSLRDPELSLLATARALKESGWDVRVRTHPREDPTPWSGFTIVADETQVESASKAQVVVGYPGSAHVLAAAVGVPVIALAPTAELAAVFTERQAASMSMNVTSSDDVLAHIGSVQAPDRRAVEAVVGPVGGAAQRVVHMWSDPPAERDRPGCRRAAR